MIGEANTRSAKVKSYPRNHLRNTYSPWPHSPGLPSFKRLGFAIVDGNLSTPQHTEQIAVPFEPPDLAAAAVTRMEQDRLTMIVGYEARSRFDGSAGR